MPRVRQCRRFVAAVSWIVPGDLRADWLREWLAEIDVMAAADPRRRHSPWTLGGRCLGAFVHALWLRRERWRIEMWTYDLGIAARSLWRQPAFLAIAALTLAVGIGANAAVFSAVYAVLLRPLPFPEADRLVAVDTVEARGPGNDSSPSDFVDWHDAASTFAGLSAYTAQSFAVAGDRPAEQAPGAFVSGDFFAVLGVPAAFGRALTVEDAQPGAPPVVVIGHQLWQRRFAGARDVVGRIETVDGTPRHIVGVMPPGVTFPLDAEVWLPLTFSPEELRTQRGAMYLTVIGRLAPTRTLADAATELRTIAARLAATYPRTNEGRTVALQPFRDHVVGDVRPALLMMLAAAGVVLLVVSVNVAGLVLTRALGRSHDYALRAALGAAPWRLVRAAMAEALVLAAVGGSAGVLIAWAGVRRIATLDVATRVPLLAGTRLDGVVLAATAGLTIATAVAVGAFPAWRTSRRSRLAGSDATRATASTRPRSSLVVAEIALALMLAVGAVSLARGFARMVAVPRGFEVSDRILTASLTMPGTQYPQAAARARFVTRALDEVRALPGVESAGAIFGLPLTGFGYVISVRSVDGVALPQTPTESVSVSVRAVSPDYFKTMAMPMRGGRDFTLGDGEDAPRVAIVNEAAARLLWPEREALGHTVSLGTRLGQDAVSTGGAIVGIVADTREGSAARPPRPTVFVPHAQEPTTFVSLVVRGAGRTPDAASLRRVLEAQDPSVPMFRVRTTAQLGSAFVSQPRLLLVLMTLFAMAAVLVAALGLYGVLAHAVAARGREIGIRRAVGATALDITRLVARDSVWSIALGVAFGVAASWMTSGLLAGFVFGASGPDTIAYLTAVAAVVVLGALAALVPCRRALAIDPAVALKTD